MFNQELNFVKLFSSSRCAWLEAGDRLGVLAWLRLRGLVVSRLDPQDRYTALVDAARAHLDSDARRDLQDRSDPAAGHVRDGHDLLVHLDDFAIALGAAEEQRRCQPAWFFACAFGSFH